MSKPVVAAVGLIAILSIAACKTTSSTQELVVQGELVRLTTDEIVEAVTGHSEVWPGRGSGYYNPNGRYEGIWDGDVVEGDWWVENDIRCYDVVDWGGEWCHELYRDGDKVVFVRQGTDLVLDTTLVEGKQF